MAGGQISATLSVKIPDVPNVLNGMAYIDEQ